MNCVDLLWTYLHPSPSTSKIFQVSPTPSLPSQAQSDVAGKRAAKARLQPPAPRGRGVRMDTKEGPVQAETVPAADPQRGKTWENMGKPWKTEDRGNMGKQIV